MATVRKNQARLSRREWAAFIDAVNATQARGAARPNYRDFVRVHVTAMTGPQSHQWGVHSMPGMLGRNFLAWHRQYLLQFERRLQEVDPDVAIPYWNWIANPRLPAAINRSNLLRRWRVRRQWQRDFLPTRAEVRAPNRRRKFAPFQRLLEQVHNNVHLAVGGEMATAQSPADPIFWLHHANVDRLWAVWQQRNPRSRPRNRTERLQPPPLFDVTVSSVLNIRALDYRYS
jgi:tyrosinase